MKLLKTLGISGECRIAANFTANPVGKPLAVVLDELGCRLDCSFAPYNQIFQEVLGAKPAGCFGGGVSILAIFIQLDRWLDMGTDACAHNAAEFSSAVVLASKHGWSAIVVIFCPSASDDRRSAAIGRLEAMIVENLTRKPGVQLVTDAELALLYPVANQHEKYNEFTEKLADIPYSEGYLAILALTLARCIFRSFAPPKKVIVVDCDNTLWSGLIGEDGIDRVIIGEEHQKLQEWLVEQSQHGRLVCICSKNNEPDVWRVFESRDEMRLLRRHIAAWRINWKPKAENIKNIAQELSLGLDSFVFIDDDIFECESVRAELPHVLTIRAVEGPKDLMLQVGRVWALDFGRVTDQDQGRTKSYHEKRARDDEFYLSASLKDFIDKLELVTDWRRVSLHNLDRALQLIERTNQFNINGKMRRMGELEEMLRNPNYCCEILNAKDRFGSYGDIGLLIYFSDEKRVVVESLAISCRALGKGLEDRLIARLTEITYAHPLRTIAIQCRTTGKNQPAMAFIEQLQAYFCRLFRPVELIRINMGED